MKQSTKTANGGYQPRDLSLNIGRILYLKMIQEAEANRKAEERSEQTANEKETQK